MWRRTRTRSSAAIEEELDRALADYRDATGVDGNAASSKRFAALARRARRDRADGLAVRLQVLAADAAFFAAQESGDPDPWALRAIDELLASVDGLGDGEPAPDEFANVAAMIAYKVMARVRIGRDKLAVDGKLARLAAAVDALVPADAEPSGDSARRAWATRALAMLSERHGDPSIGQERLLAGQRRAHADDDPESWMELARAYYVAERKRASTVFAWADLVATRYSLRARADELRSHFRSRAGRLWAAQVLAEILGELLHDEFDEKNTYPVDHMFAAMEAPKARTLLDALRHQYAPLPPTEGRAAQALERKLTRFAPPIDTLDDLARTQQEVSLVSRLPIGSPWDKQERKRLLDSIERLYASHDAGFSDLAAPARLEDIQSVLEPREALIQYVAFPYGLAPVPATDIWAVVVTRERAEMTTRIRLTAAEGEFGGSYFADDRSPVEASPLTNRVVATRMAIQDRHRDDADADESLSLLYNVLIEPIFEAGFEPSDFSRWIVIPDGPLHFVPFGALKAPDGRRLISDVALSVAPSASVLHRLRQQPGGTLESYLALIDPDLAHVPRPRLRQGPQEIAALERTLAPLNGDMITGEAANEPALRELAPGRSIVHLTTHGEFPEDDAIDLHRVLLAKSEGDDGRLHAEEIRRLDLSAAQLFTLNVCDAGLFRVGHGDEPYGLVPALVNAGAGNVLATLWPVEHEVSRHFFAAFYSALLESGPAEALQSAALAFIEDGAPLRQWCGFALSGSATPFGNRSA